MKRLLLAATLLASALALCACQREAKDGITEISGKMFVFNYRIATATATNGTTTTTTVNDYADNGDSPAWSTMNGSWTREIAGPGGMLDATVAQSGTVTLQLTNLQGSEVATAADATTDTGIDTGSYATYNE